MPCNWVNGDTETTHANWHSVILFLSVFLTMLIDSVEMCYYFFLSRSLHDATVPVEQHAVALSPKKKKWSGEGAETEVWPPQDYYHFRISRKLFHYVQCRVDWLTCSGTFTHSHSVCLCRISLVICDRALAVGHFPITVHSHRRRWILYCSICCIEFTHFQCVVALKMKSLVQRLARTGSIVRAHYWFDGRKFSTDLLRRKEDPRPLRVSRTLSVAVRSGFLRV